MPLPLHQQPSSGGLAPAVPSVPLLGLLMLLHNAWALPVQSGDFQEVVPVWTASPLEGEGHVSFSVAAFGKEFALQLVPDASFLAPRLKIQHVGRKEPARSLAEEDAGTVRRCFYSGTVNWQPDSLVALSLCQGIHGSFLVDGDKYLIQPQGDPSGDPLLQVHQLQKQGWLKEGAGDIPTREAQEDNATTRSRAKRFTSEARYVETLLVADASMVQFYGDELKAVTLRFAQKAIEL
uniref:Uncharacterized protein n=1 Tax=Sphaerodactylus townsendi TaxID=933632 RepID=A0ACB8EY11_9SAUR